MGLEYDNFESLARFPRHLSELHRLFHDVYGDLLLYGREQTDPQIALSIEKDCGVTVDQDTLLMYLRGLTVLVPNNADETVEAPASTRIEQLTVFLCREYYLKDRSILGQATSPPIPGIHDIEIILGHRRHPKAELHHLWDNIGLSFFANSEEIDWLYRFWQNYNPKNPLHHELLLNHTALHEVRHLGHQVQRFINLLNALTIAEREHHFSSLPRQDAFHVFRQVYETVRIHIPRETDSEAYALTATKAIYDETSPVKLPKIISIADPSRYFTFINKGRRRRNT